MASHIVLTEELTTQSKLTDLLGVNRILSVRLKTEIMRVFWGNHLYDIARFDVFFKVTDYMLMISKCRIFVSECQSAVSSFRGQHFPLKTFADLLKVVKYVKCHINETKIELLRQFHSNTPTEDLCTQESKICALEIAVHLWLMINMSLSNTTPNRFAISQRTKIFWPQDQSLEAILVTHFPKNPSPTMRRSRWPFIFNAHNMHRIGGFTFLWTDDLQDHLLLDEDEKSVMIFQHISVLQALAEGDCSEMIKDLAKETMQTLSLLFPIGDRDCQKWLEKKMLPAISDDGAFDLRMAALSTGRETRVPSLYKYWEERLSVIMESFDETEPTTLSQWWYDERRGVQRWTFWLAAVALALTVIFGFLQTLIGAWQVYLVYNPPV